MSEDYYDVVKQALLDHIREIFEEMEEALVRSHEEKYAMLEDVLENASDVDELRVAFCQWHHDHSDDLDFEYELGELWANALANSDLDMS